MTSLSIPVVRRPARAVAGWVRRSPGTYTWLGILALTTFALTRIDPEALDYFLGARSTNLDGLARDPLRVLISSALWTDEPNFVYYLVVFHIFHVPAERWLGTRRWLTVVATAHVGATLISQGTVWLGIHTGVIAASQAGTLDIGVSYTLAGVAGVLTYSVARPWRWIYLAGALVFLGVPLITKHTFTDVGHFSALLIGLSCHHLTKGRPTWSPATLWTRLTRRPPTQP